MKNAIHHGDCLKILQAFPEQLVQCCITSPPYYGLRSYLPEEHPDKPLEIGLEETPLQYIDRLVQVFREVRRILKDDGVLWLNIGDTYANDAKWGGHTSGKHVRALHGSFQRPKRYTGLPAKNLIGIPWRLAFALQDDGWIIRSDVIWHKPTAMPESVTDRPTKAHEYLFLLAKSEHYYYDADAIREPHTTKSNFRNKTSEAKEVFHTPLAPIGEGTREWNNPLGRNKRDVWTVAAQPYTEAHFATMPPKLVEPCLLAGTSPKACEHCGSAWTRITEQIPMRIHKGPKAGGYGSRTTDNLSGTMLAPAQRHTIGWQPTCQCSHATGEGRCLVLDPFMGAGTVALVALQQGRDYVGIELNKDYIELAQQRIATVQPVLWSGSQEEDLHENIIRYHCD